MSNIFVVSSLSQRCFSTSELVKKDIAVLFVTCKAMQNDIYKFDQSPCECSVSRSWTDLHQWRAIYGNKQKRRKPRRTSGNWCKLTKCLLLSVSLKRNWLTDDDWAYNESGDVSERKSDNRCNTSSEDNSLATTEFECQWEWKSKTKKAQFLGAWALKTLTSS